MSAHPEWLERRTLTRDEAFRAVYRGALVAVSHRWESAEAPDLSGQQLAAVREFLRRPEGAAIQAVWYDFWCMPQVRDDSDTTRGDAVTGERLVPGGLCAG